MNNKIIILIIFVVMSLSCVVYVPPSTSREPHSYSYEERYRGRVSDYDISFFYDYLAPYGFWVRHSRYGHVWIPRIELLRWRPYTYGYWVWTDYGWTWVSSFKWGWAAFHYGRWGWDAHLGWYWVPGNVWAPAWVVWRHGRDYIGWAPLPPDVRFIPGIGIRSIPDLSSDYWIFVEGAYFQHSRLYRYVLPGERSLTLINITNLRAGLEVRNKVVNNRALAPELVESITRTRIRKYNLEHTDSPSTTKVRINQVEMFKPEIRDNSLARPRQVINEEEARTRVKNEFIVSSGEVKRIENPESLNKVHAEEVRLLEETQQKEIKKLEEEYKAEKT
ncbi:MAG: DUF6600 domain-containing protein, partial [Acidobacteriota bacterium]